MNIEHVSSADLIEREISRRSPAGRALGQACQQNLSLPIEALLQVFRRWFMTRKPDAGFLLSGFPATMLQAQVFDDWLDARNEVLDAAFTLPGESLGALHTYYQTRGLLRMLTLF